MKTRAFPQKIYVSWEPGGKGDPPVLTTHESADDLNIGEVGAVYVLKELVKPVVVLETVQK